MHEQFFDELREDLRLIKKILMGNGSIGLDEKVRNNTRDINSIKRDKIGKWIIRIMLTLCTLATGALAVKQFIK